MTEDDASPQRDAARLSAQRGVAGHRARIEEHASDLDDDAPALLARIAHSAHRALARRGQCDDIARPEERLGRAVGKGDAQGAGFCRMGSSARRSASSAAMGRRLDTSANPDLRAG
jgi:hypothetical protein